MAQDVAEFVEDMRRKRTETGNLQPALEQCVAIVREGIEHNFDSAQTAVGQTWPPHAPSTVARYGPHPLLILSGKLKAAALGGGEGAIELVGDDGFQIGVSGMAIPYAGVHQEGGGNNIPQREYFAMSDETVERCMDLIADFALAQMSQ